jgi:hypothetical protein
MTYEYKVILEERSLNNGPHPQLEKLGQDGWELVSVRENHSYPILYLKRPKPVGLSFGPVQIVQCGPEGEAIPVPISNPGPTVATGSKVRRLKP